MNRRNFAIWPATCGMLIALQVVMGNLLQVSFIGKQYNLGFLPVAAAGWLLGVPGGLIVGALGDLIGALLFPTGPYFVGFTLTSALVGALFGLLLYRGRSDGELLKFVLAVVLSVLLTLLVNWLLNSYWLSLLYGSKTYTGWLIARGISYLIEWPLQSVLIFLCLTALKRIRLPGLGKGSAE